MENIGRMQLPGTAWAFYKGNLLFRKSNIKHK